VYLYADIINRHEKSFLLLMRNKGAKKARKRSEDVCFNDELVTLQQMNLSDCFLALQDTIKPCYHEIQGDFWKMLSGFKTQITGKTWLDWLQDLNRVLNSP
jgi:hypothetical protein